MDQNKIDNTAFALADSHFATCQEIEKFIVELVLPILTRASINSEEHQTYIDLIKRVHLWIRSLTKLNHPEDFQPIRSASRALFEIAIDFTIMQFNHSYEKLIAWEESARLHSVERIQRYYNQHPGEITDGDSEVLRVIERKERILELRRKYWNNDRHPTRWTGRNLSDDAIDADRLYPSEFQKWYDTKYAHVCWNVHGSSLVGIRGIPVVLFPIISAFGFCDSAKFSLISCKMALKLLNKWDPITEVRFEMFNNNIKETMVKVFESYKLGY